MPSWEEDEQVWRMLAEGRLEDMPALTRLNVTRYLEYRRLTAAYRVFVQKMLVAFVSALVAIAVGLTELSSHWSHLADVPAEEIAISVASLFGGVVLAMYVLSQFIWGSATNFYEAQRRLAQPYRAVD